MPQQLVLEYAKILIPFIGFAFVIVQLKYLRRTAESNANAKLYDQYLKINELFLQKPRLRPYFYDGMPLAEDSHDVQDLDLKGEIHTMCEAIAGVLEHATFQCVNLPNDPRDNCWKAYMRERLQKSPLLRQFLADSQDWYAVEFRSVITELGVVLPPPKAGKPPNF